MKIRRKSSQSSFFVNPSRTIKSAVECLESSYFPVRRFGSGSFGKISPMFMKSWCSCQNNSNGLQRFEYGVFGISTLQTFNLLLCLFIATIFIFSTICQMHYIFCCRAFFFISIYISLISLSFNSTIVSVNMSLYLSPSNVWIGTIFFGFIASTNFFNVFVSACPLVWILYKVNFLFVM
jgi:hypothetical protein